MYRTALHVGICTIVLLTVGATAMGLTAGSPDTIDNRISELTPDVAVVRTFDDTIRLLGYDIADTVSSDDGKHHVKLDKSAGFGLTLYWEQITPSNARYQVLVQFSDIVYDERSGLAELDEYQSFGYIRRLPVDVARGVVDTEVRQTGAVYKTGLTITVPYFVLRAGETELKVGLILPDGTVMPSLFIGKLVFDGVPRVQTESTVGLGARADRNNLLGNAGFESIPQCNTARNWTFWNSRGVMQFRDPRHACEGVRSLRLDFFGGLDPHVYSKYQDVTVKPDTDYVLSWYGKSERITSSRGPRLSVYDADKGWEHFVVAGEAMVGTTPWHKMSLAFRTPSDTVKLRVFIDRAGADDWKKLPAKDRVISGSAWFDLVQLVEKR